MKDYQFDKWFDAVRVDDIRAADEMSVETPLRWDQVQEAQNRLLGLLRERHSDRELPLGVLLALQGVALQNAPVLDDALAQARQARDRKLARLLLSLSATNERWRRVLARILLARRSAFEWEPIGEALGSELARLARSRAKAPPILKNLERVLDAKDVAKVDLNLAGERRLRDVAVELDLVPGPSRDRTRRALDVQPFELESFTADDVDGLDGAAVLVPKAANGDHAEPEADVQAARGAEPEAKPIVRTPHLALTPDGPLLFDTKLDVRVYADTSSPAPGEQSEPLAADVRAGQNEVSVAVWISHTSHFELIGQPVGVLRLDRTKPKSIQDATFKLRVRSEREIADLALTHAPAITACFAYEGHPAGKVTRTVALASGDAPAVPPSRASRMVLRSVAQRADLEVHITRDPDGYPWRFECRVCGPDLVETRGPWILPDRRDAQELLRKCMATFVSETTSAEQRPDALRGAGIGLFAAAPPNFKQAFWLLVDQKRPPRTLAIFSEEPSIPWELMVPKRKLPSGTERLEALGVLCAIGRWVHPDSESPPQSKHITSSYVVAPEYEKDPLKHADEEADYVCDNLGGSKITPSTYASITQALSAKPVSLLHFACHGESGGDGQAILLGDDERMSADAVRGSSEFEQGFRDGPVVFLNACEIGRQEPSLAGPDGFAPAFAEIGASAVIAALWSVEDDVAHEVALHVYGEMQKKPPPSLAEALRSIRARAYTKQGRDSYAAYCLYGDPCFICSTAES